MNMTPMPFFPRIATSALALAAALAGCASAPVHYYTLSAPAGTASAPAGAQAAYMIDVLPVSVPTPADQPQLMVRNGDGSVSALYSERWTRAAGRRGPARCRTRCSASWARWTCAW